MMHEHECGHGCVCQDPDGQFFKECLACSVQGVKLSPKEAVEAFLELVAERFSFQVLGWDPSR